MHGIKPQIEELTPKDGDVHHVSIALLQEALRAVPARYHRELAGIDLAPRPDEIGRPYGSYDSAAKRISLFSTPADSWFFPRYEAYWSYGFEQWGASVKNLPSGTMVHWKSGSLPCFYITVLCHQLAQHFNHLSGAVEVQDIEMATNENLADFHSLKLLLMTSPTFAPIKQALQELCDRIKAEGQR